MIHDASRVQTFLREYLDFSHIGRFTGLGHGLSELYFGN